MNGDSAHRRWGPRQAARFGWAVASVFVVESVVIGAAALPAIVFYEWHLGWDLGPRALHLFLLGAAFVPTYLLFALLLMLLSAIAMRLLRWRPPRRAELSIADLDWPLCDWGRYQISSHVVRLLAGGLLRATPAWDWYLRLNGARLGRRVWVNSLGVGDHCLLDFGDDVVIGSDVHLSGHTVEQGVVRLAPVTLGAGTTVGVGSHIGIGVVTGPRCQIGSLTVVPKFSRLDGHATYVGAPARRLDAPEPG